MPSVMQVWPALWMLACDGLAEAGNTALEQHCIPQEGPHLCMLGGPPLYMLACSTSAVSLGHTRCEHVTAA